MPATSEADSANNKSTVNTCCIRSIRVLACECFFIICILVHVQLWVCCSAKPWRDFGINAGSMKTLPSAHRESLHCMSRPYGKRVSAVTPRGDLTVRDPYGWPSSGAEAAECCETLRRGARPVLSRKPCACVARRARRALQALILAFEVPTPKRSCHFASSWN